MTSTNTKTRKTLHRIEDMAYDSLTDIIEKVDLIILENPDAGLKYSDFKFEYYHEYGEDRMCLEYSLPETPYEKAAREKRETQSALEREKYERQQFEHLKKKYGE